MTCPATTARVEGREGGKRGGREEVPRKREGSSVQQFQWSSSHDIASAAIMI
jgi:hypothetical protein